MAFFSHGPYQPGNRLVECERCGFTCRFNEAKREVNYNGVRGPIVCPKCNDEPHPLDYPVRHRPEGRLERIN